MSSPGTPVSGVLTDPGRTGPSTARADRRAPGVTGPGGSSRPCNGRRRRQQSTLCLDVQCPPNGRTSALGEGPARDWQIYVSRGSQGTAAAQVGRSPSWSAAQTFLADGIPSLREQECCDDPVSHCPAGGATAMQPAKEPMGPKFRRNCRRGLSCSSLPACAYNTHRQASRAKLDESRKQTCLLLGGVNVSAALEVQKANPQSPQSGLKKVAAGIRVA